MNSRQRVLSAFAHEEPDRDEMIVSIRSCMQIPPGVRTGRSRIESYEFEELSDLTSMVQGIQRTDGSQATSYHNTSGYAMHAAGGGSRDGGTAVSPRRYATDGSRCRQFVTCSTATKLPWSTCKRKRHGVGSVTPSAPAACTMCPMLSRT